MPHFWVRGNLPLCSLCFKCLTPCGDLPKLADFRCVWCHKTGHEDCIEEMDSDSNTCCLGPHQNLVIPPNCVTLRLEGWRGRRKLVVKAIKSPSIDHWQPLVVMANPRSGGKDGEAVLSAMRKLLNPIQVSLYILATEDLQQNSTVAMVMCCHGDKTWCHTVRLMQTWGLLPSSFILTSFSFSPLFLLPSLSPSSLIHPPLPSLSPSPPFSLPLLPHSPLTPSQVIDLSETPPEGGLEICRLLSQHSCRVLVCGGDGTVGWVLTAIDKCRLPVSYTV